MQADKFYKFVCPECGFSVFTDGDPECVKCDETPVYAPSNLNGNMGFIKNDPKRRDRERGANA